MYTAVLGITWQACWHSSAVENVRVCPFTVDPLKNPFISKQSALSFLASKKENEQVNWLNWHSCPNLTTEKTRCNFFTFLIVEAYLRLVQVCPERAWLVFFLPLVTLARDGLDFSGGAAAEAPYLSRKYFTQQSQNSPHPSLNRKVITLTNSNFPHPPIVRKFITLTVPKKEEGGKSSQIWANWVIYFNMSYMLRALKLTCSVQVLFIFSAFSTLKPSWANKRFSETFM